MENKLYCKVKLNRFSKHKFLEDFFLKGIPSTHIDGRVQCSEGRRRSFGDLLWLTKSYFKTATAEEVAWILREICLKYDDKLRSSHGIFIGCLYCPDIDKIVFHNRSNNWCYNTFMNSNHGQSIFYGTCSIHIKDDYSIIKILKLALTHGKSRK